MIGNSCTGVVIGLDAESAVFTDSLLNQENISPRNEKENELLNEYKNSGFFSESMPAVINTAYFHITSRCNLQCIGCYSEEADRNSKPDITTQQCLTILDSLKKARIRNLIISGGEPFLRQDLTEILEYAKVKCQIPVVQVVSNGMMEQHRYDCVLPYVDSISISVDGYNEKTKFLRNSNMKHVLDVVKYLSTKTPKVNMIFTINAKNLHYIKNYIELSNRLKVPFSFSMLTVRNEAVFAPFYLGDKEYSVIASMAKKQWLPIDDTPYGECLSCKTSCGHGRRIISIAANGDIFPCHMLHEPKLKIGNVLRDSVIINSSHYNDVLGDVEKINECSACELKYLCGGGCYARRYFDNGSIADSHDPGCRLYQIDINRAIESMLIANTEM